MYIYVFICVTIYRNKLQIIIYIKNNLKLYYDILIYNNHIMNCQNMIQLKQAYELNPINLENESPERLAVREFVQNQSIYRYGMPIAEHILNAIVNGFFIFNLRKDKNMVKSKDELLKYIADENVSLEERLYFRDIFLYNQRPRFLSFNEHEYIRACGTLDGFFENPDDESDYESDEEYVKPIDTRPTDTPVFGFTRPATNACSTPTTERRPSGFVAPTLLSDELATFLGKPVGTMMARTDVSKLINTYIQTHGLQDVQNGRIINPDAKLRKLLRLNHGDELTYFNLQRYMKHHFSR